VNLVWRFRGSIKLGLAPGPQAQKELSMVPRQYGMTGSPS
jgi:hypothetical protein